MILNTPCYTLWLKILNNYETSNEKEKVLRSVALSVT